MRFRCSIMTGSSFAFDCFFAYMTTMKMTNERGTGWSGVKCTDGVLFGNGRYNAPWVQFLEDLAKGLKLGIPPLHLNRSL